MRKKPVKKKRKKKGIWLRNMVTWKGGYDHCSGFINASLKAANAGGGPRPAVLAQSYSQDGAF